MKRLLVLCPLSVLFLLLTVPAARSQDDAILSEGKNLLDMYRTLAPENPLPSPETVDPTSTWRSPAAMGKITAGPLRVNVMPGSEPGWLYPYTWPGRTLTIWGNVHGGTPPYTYEWDFGDGSAPVGGAVTDPHYIAVTHSYATMGPKYAQLTVTDAALATDQDVVRIEVVVQTTDVEINAAIEDGLRWLYRNQWANGRWSSYGGYNASATAMALLAFENHNHLPINDFDEDIYAEYVELGFDYLFSTFYVTAVPVQTAGNPEEIVPGNIDNNGIGIGVNTDRTGYETGMAMMAIVASGPLTSGAPLLTANAGPAGVVGRSYFDIVVDMVDWCAWAQNEPGNPYYRGGWRYGPNYSSSDNSVSQWPAIGLEAAETNWGIEAPAFVKSELLLWLANSQRSGGFYNGAFWYTDYWPWNPFGVTGSGMCGLAYADISKSNSRMVDALGYLARDWTNGAHKSNHYNLYAISKACRIAVDDFGNLSEIINIDGINWYDDYSAFLLGTQSADGRWSAYYFGDVLNTSWAILILSQSVAELTPVAVICGPESAPPGYAFAMDGEDSYHLNPDKHIVEWLWDFDASDGVNWGSPDAVGIYVTNPGYGALGTYTVTLRVADDSDPVMTDTDEKVIDVTIDNHPPVADANGPYAGMLGEVITFDGTGSYDFDLGDYIDSYAWDLDGDGYFDDCFDPICTHSWSYLYSGYVGLIVTDSYGEVSDPSEAYVTVWTSEVDVGLDVIDIAFSNPLPLPGEIVTVSATVHCDLLSNPIGPVEVRFYDGDPDIAVHQIDGDQIIPLMTAGDVVTVQVDYLYMNGSSHGIFVRVDPDNEWEEYNEDNNETFATLCPDNDGDGYGACVDCDETDPDVNPGATEVYNGIDDDCDGLIDCADPDFVGTADFDVSADPDEDEIVWKPFAGYAFFDVIVTSFDCYNDPVTLSVTGLPVGAIGTFSPTVVTPPIGSSVNAGLGITAAKTTPVGDYTLTIKGDDGVLVHTTTVALTVTPWTRPPIGGMIPKLGMGVPDEYVLAQNYPNPFNPETNLEFGLPEDSHVRVSVYNTLGQMVDVLADTELPAGYYRVPWDATGLPTGVYFYRIEADNFTATRRMVYMK